MTSGASGLQPCPFSTQLLWFEGKPVPITRPQNDYTGHTTYKGSEPVFIMTPLQRMQTFITEADAAFRNGESYEVAIRLRRLKMHKFTRRLPARADQIPKCRACFASFALEGEAAYWQG